MERLQRSELSVYRTQGSFATLGWVMKRLRRKCEGWDPGKLASAMRNFQENCATHSGSGLFIDRFRWSPLRYDHRLICAMPTASILESGSVRATPVVHPPLTIREATSLVTTFLSRLQRIC